MFNKIASAICWIVWIATFFWCIDLAEQNARLQEIVDMPCNCEEVCSTLFEEMGC